MGSPDRLRIEQDSGPDGRWEMASRRPCEPLRPYVRSLMGYDSRPSDPEPQRRFPQPYVVMIIEFGTPIRIMRRDDEATVIRHPGGFVAGLADSFAVTEQEGWQAGVQVDLTPTGARRVLGLPLSELGEEVVALQDVRPGEFRALVERLGESGDWSDRLTRVEAFLLHRISQSPIDSAQVDWAIDRIERSGGNLSIGSLSRELGCSPRHLIARFRDQVGIPPKRLARIVRFERTMAEIRHERNRSLAELALRLGFSDQAHLARDIRHFTGWTASTARNYVPALAEVDS